MSRAIFTVLILLLAAGSHAAQGGDAISMVEKNGVWTLANGRVQLQLAASGSGVKLVSLRSAAGEEWAAAATDSGVSLSGIDARLSYAGGTVSERERGARELALTFRSSTGISLTQYVRLFPRSPVLEFSALLENASKDALLDVARIDPVTLSLRPPQGPVQAYSPDEVTRGFYPRHHGFQRVADVCAGGGRSFPDWLVLSDTGAEESLIVGGDLAANILPWCAHVSCQGNQFKLIAGNTPPRISAARRGGKDGHLASPAGNQEATHVIDVLPGEKVFTPISFVALAAGDADDAGNAVFRYLRAHVFPEPLPDAPLLGYSVWLTEDYAGEILRDEIRFARQAGFEVFYLDASWYEDASLVPGMNDWSKGLGSYRESRQKFPGGLQRFSDEVRAAGMKFGLWVNPPNVDLQRVTSGEIPRSWLARIDGEFAGTDHPSLSRTRQLTFANPEVVAWLKRQLGDVIEKWNVEWIKWDPSATVSTATDRGSRRGTGGYMEYAGRMEVMKYLTQRFPALNGFEMPPTLRYSRTNPGPRGLLPGGYTNELIHGPMVSPSVWGSLASAGAGEAGASVLTGRWYSASYLDYDLRKHFTHGVIYSNINGASSQLFSRAPPGYVVAFKRAAHQFKQYRHLLFGDVFHPRLAAAQDWSATQYVDDARNESVLFVFRDGAETADNVVKLRGLDAAAVYEVVRLNDRPGRAQQMTGAVLMTQGIAVSLPHPWLAEGDGPAGAEFQDQLRFGSDILMLKKVRN